MGIVTRRATGVMLGVFNCSVCNLNSRYGNTDYSNGNIVLKLLSAPRYDWVLFLKVFFHFCLLRVAHFAVKKISLFIPIDFALVHT